MIPSTALTSFSQPMRERMTEYINELQETIVAKLETYGLGQKFRRESWTREEGGGGVSYTFPPQIDASSSSIADHPIEKAAVNVSTIYGILPPAAVKQMSTAHAALKNIDKSLPFFTAGLSLILHPRHPRVPAVHTNYRYFEVLDAPLLPTSMPENENLDSEPTVLAWWFGAITDMTPCYVNKTDFCHFHTTLKTTCDTWSDTSHTSTSVYPPFKKSCDDYLFIPHRHEHRGIGGIRFDDMDSDAMRALLTDCAQPDVSKEYIACLCDQESLFALVKSLGDSFLPCYIDIMERHMGDPFVPSEKRWQLLRRGRAVEFTLVAERGTKFGLVAPGVNAENVLVSMPPEARWEYCSDLGAEDQNTAEAEMVRILEEPRSWID